jgi:hypothetical protein
MPTNNIITISSEHQRRRYLSLPRLRPASDAAPPLAHSRPPVMSPTFLRLPNRTSQEWQGSNHDVVAHNKHGEELLVTIPPILALYARSMPARRTKRRSRPLFPRTEQNHTTIHVSEASVLYASQTEGQTRRHRDNHDSTCRSCDINRTPHVKARRLQHQRTGGHSSNSGTSPTTGRERRPQIFLLRKNIM